MQQMYGLYGQPFYFEVVRQIGCNRCNLQCGNVHRNQYYTVINKINPMYYFYQLPDEFVRVDANGYLYADSSMMQNNFIDYWSRTIYEEILRKGYGIYKKYKGLVNKSNNAKC